ncbi:unnamed protein product [Zymoseptoria tritici ST99CH_3D7]|uniref:Uncharacterized protein n=2 Tax=Zymoseptoria tritici TaxID=1047171 RepID=A0A1X7S6E5_ZYMT9|nr:unnamed protein product [Zymoseptoria tritici ST99CH_3D7]
MDEADAENKASGEQDRDLVRDLVGTEHLWNKCVKPNMAMQADEGIAIAEEDKTVVQLWFRRLMGARVDYASLGFLSNLDADYYEAQTWTASFLTASHSSFAHHIHRMDRSQYGLMCMEISLLPAQDKKRGTKKTVTEVPEELDTIPARFPRDDPNYAFSCALYFLFMIKPIRELFDTPGLVGWERLFNMQSWTSITQPPTTDREATPSPRSSPLDDLYDALPVFALSAELAKGTAEPARLVADVSSTRGPREGIYLTRGAREDVY